MQGGKHFWKELCYCSCSSESSVRAWDQVGYEHMTGENGTSSVNRAAVNEILSQQLNYLFIFLQMSSPLVESWQFVLKHLSYKPVACVPEQANSEQTKNKWQQYVNRGRLCQKTK